MDKIDMNGPHKCFLLMTTHTPITSAQSYLEDLSFVLFFDYACDVHMHATSWKMRDHIPHTAYDKALATSRVSITSNPTSASSYVGDFFTVFPELIV
jgi:hypothetical protein